MIANALCLIALIPVAAILAFNVVIVVHQALLFGGFLFDGLKRGFFP